MTQPGDAPSDDLTDSTPDHGHSWLHMITASNLMGVYPKSAGTNLLSTEISEDDDLEIEMVIRRFLRRVREENQEDLLKTLGSALQHQLSDQDTRPTIFFLGRFPCFALPYLLFELHEYGVSEHGLFRRITLTYKGDRTVHILFFVEREAAGDWVIATLHLAH